MNSHQYLKNVTTLKLDQSKCTGCTMCTQVCPHAVFEVTSGKATITDRDKCMECGACMRNCPEEALTVKTGVGCAAGVINGWLRGSEPTCDCAGNNGESCC